MTILNHPLKALGSLEPFKGLLFSKRACIHSVFLVALCLLARPVMAGEQSMAPATKTWMPDNGNGTYTNPLFQDEFTDPDIIRVGEDFYLAGTTMHAMPGLVVLHSKDLVNWTFLSYAIERLDLGPEFRLENGREAYGNGIWAPCLRYHKGTFYLFSNVNHHGLQVFTSKDPAGPWQHRSLGSMLHDLSVLFDDDGRVYAIYNYDEVKMIELKPDLSGFVEGSERVIIPHGSAMGEGHHFYKIGGKYYIISADYGPVGRMQCARADRPEGPYETTVISSRETMGNQRGLWLNKPVLDPEQTKQGPKLDVYKPGENEFGAVPLHQGGIVDLPNGDWWGFSMMDYRAIGRTTFLSPVTWQDGWPYFGLPGNLGRTPRTWIKPAVRVAQAPSPTYQRDDDFSGPRLRPLWQWNHAPVDGKWSLAEKPGVLRLHTLPADQFLWAKNSLTQRVIGPESSATVVLDGSGLKVGDIAGLGLLNVPCAWLGIARTEEGFVVRWFNQATNETVERPLESPRLSLRAEGVYDADHATLGYSTDGEHFTKLGGEIPLPFQLKTFQGVRYALFAFNTRHTEGGYADFDSFRVVEPLADRSHNLPLGKVITLANLADGNRLWAGPRGILRGVKADSTEGAGAGARFRVLDRGLGRVALEAMDGGGFITVFGLGLSADVRLSKIETEGSLFQWQDLLRGDCMLLSLKTHRYVSLDPATGEPYSADSPGPRPDRKDGSVLHWTESSAGGN